MAGNGRLLDGIKVLDVASFIAGPVSTTIMADFGADVIKIEPPGGDLYRRSSRNAGYPLAQDNYPWIVDNRSKKGIVIDLKSDEGRAVVYRLARDADVFVTNLPLDARKRLRMTWEDIGPLNERLIYASLTAYGETGEEAGKTGFDSTALWARTGLMDLMRPSPDSPPARSLPGMGDHPTGIALFGAIMTGLYQRERTGKGGMVSTSLMANGLWWNAIMAQAMLCGAEFQVRPPREDATNALTNLYRCRDGRWFMMVLLAEERRWEPFATCIGRPDLLADPRFATREARLANVRDLIGILDGVFAEKDWAEWRQILDANGIAFGVIGTVRDIPDDPQMRAIGAITPMADPRGGPAFTVNSPIWVEGQAKRPPTLPPSLGEHTDEVLRAAGYGEAEIARLRESGAVS